MKKSRYLLIALLSMILAVILTTAVFAEDHGSVVDSGQCGDNLTWTLYEDGLLEISGTGEMRDYKWEWYNNQYNSSSPWFQSRSQFKELKLNEGITKIGDYAFGGCFGWFGFTGSLTIPDSVTKIGEGSFYECDCFTGSLTIPDSVTTIGESAFYRCKGFTGSLTIGNGVTTIGGAAFYGCYGFTGSLTIPDSVTTIGGSAFSYCGNFTGSLTIGNSVTTIGGGAFESCRFTGNLIIPDSVTTIGNEAFGGCIGFTGGLTIGNSVTTIEEGAFAGCYGFTGSLTIPDSVTTIGEGAFVGCTGFTGSLIIPNSVTDIEHAAFIDCNGFTGSLTIPDSVILIGDSAFYDCGGFTGSLTIPDSVTTIGREAFRGCGSLTSASFYGDAPSSFGDDVFTDCADGFTIYYLEGKSGWTTPEWNGYPCYPVDSIPGMEPDVDNSIIFGKDQWNFSNSYKYFNKKDGNKAYKDENYFMNAEDYLMLYNALHDDPVTWSLINENLSNSWGGSCYGMSSIVVLAKMGLIKATDISESANDIYSIVKSIDDRVESYINFYQIQQYMPAVKNAIAGFTALTSSQQLERIENMAAQVKNGGTPILIGFGNSEESHAIVGYGVEHDSYIFDEKVFDSRILTYDPIYPNGWYKAYIYYNKDSGEWYCPDNSEYDTIMLATNNMEVLNAIDHGDEKLKNPIIITKQDLNNLSLLIDNITWKLVEMKDTLWQGGIYKYADLIKVINEEESTDTIASNVNIVLPSMDSAYTIIADEVSSSDFTFVYDHTLQKVKSDSFREATFCPDGSLSVDGINGEFSVSIVADDEISLLPWNNTELSGVLDEAQNIMIRNIEQGFVLEGFVFDNIDVTVSSVFDDQEPQSLRINTNENAVLLTSKEVNQVEIPVVLIDADHNGDYETEIDTDIVTLVGDVNADGDVDATDRMILARYLAGWEGYEEKIKSKEAADIDGDGDITAKDRMILARKLAGWEGYDQYFTISDK